MYFCAQDIMEYLMNSVGGGAQDSEHRLLRAAAHHAYRDVTSARDWQWHITTGTLTTPDAGPGPGKSYTLPANVRNVDSIIPPVTSLHGVEYVSPADWTRLNVVLPTLNSPLFWTVMKHPSLYDRWVLKIAGAPDTTVTFTYTYRRKPPPLRYMGYEEASRNGSLTTTGLVKRYGTATAFPEGPAGINPFTAEEIVGVAGSLVGTPPVNAKTVVSDYVDASDTMFTAILSCAEVWAAKMLGKNVEGAMTVYARDLRMAFEADVVAPLSGHRTDGIVVGGPRALGYYSPSGPDTGV
jgi:hypothetical protein